MLKSAGMGGKAVSPGKLFGKSVSSERPRPDPLALAMEWVAKITAVGLEMALPAIGGGYLDRRLGTGYWALIGVGVGVTVGMWHLLLMTRPKAAERGRKNERGGTS